MNWWKKQTTTARVLALLLVVIFILGNTPQLLRDGYFVASGPITPTANGVPVGNGTAFAVVSAGASNTTFLRGDSTWATPTASGGLPAKSSGAGTPNILNSVSTTVTGANNILINSSASVGATLTNGTGDVLIGDSADVGAAAATGAIAIGQTAVAPNGGLTIGQSSGHAGITGGNFTCVGNLSGQRVTTGGSNTFIGANTAQYFTTSTDNTVIGAAIAGVAAVNITTPSNFNTLIGSSAANNLGGTGTCASNIVVGVNGANTLSFGSGNIIIGNNADTGSTTDANDVCVGNSAVCPTGGTVIGRLAGKAGATAARFTAIGNTSGGAITSGADNTFVGDQAGKAVTLSPKNTFVGSSAGAAVLSNATGLNTFVGFQAGLTATGQANTLIGGSSAFTLTTGTNNVLVGEASDAGSSSDAGDVGIGFSAVCPTGGIVIGKSAGNAGTTAARLTAIGNTAAPAITTADDSVLVGDHAGGSVSGGTAISTGVKNTLVGSQTSVNATGSNQASIFGYGCRGAAGACIFAAGAAYTSATTNDLYIGSGDTGLNRVAAGVVGPNTGNGATTGAWFQNVAGDVRLASDYTNATNTFSNTALSVTVTNGRKYSFHAVLIYANSTAGEGAQFDFNGGGATSTNFVAGSADAISNTVTTTLAGTYTQGTVTGNNITTIDGTFEPSSTGTFIIRGAEAIAHVSGTLTIKRGSYLWVHDMP